jgi:acyl-CoA thioesterase-2
MWFHASFRADEWLLYVQEAPVRSSARGLARGHIYRRDGRLAVSVVQEGLARVAESGAHSPSKPNSRPSIRGAGLLYRPPSSDDRQDSAGGPS